MLSLSPPDKLQFFADDGTPAAGFKLYTYATGTTDLLATYADKDGTASNPNPITLDARGEATVYLQDGMVYDYKWESPDGTHTYKRPGISVANGLSDLASTSAGKGADLVGFLQSGAGAVPRTIQDKSCELVHVTDFMTKEQRQDVANRTFSQDVTDAFQAALAFANRRKLRIPAGRYRLSSELMVTGGIDIEGDGISCTTLEWTSDAASSGIQITLENREASWQTFAGVSGLELLTRKYNSGTALLITGANNGNPGMSNAVVKDIAIRGTAGPLADGWNQGIWFNHCSNVIVDRVFFCGLVDSSGEPNYLSDRAIRYDNAARGNPHQTVMQLSNVVATYVKQAIDISDTEGVLIDKVQLVGVEKGVVVSGPLAFPHFSITNSHINASVLAIELRNVQEIFISGNLLFKQLGAFPGTGINVLSGAKKGRIVDNTFDNLNVSSGAAMNGIILDDGSNIYVSGNSFRKEPTSPAGVGIWIASGSGNVIGRNFFEPGITPTLDGGTGTIQPDMRVMLTRSTPQSFSAGVASDMSWNAAPTEIGKFWNIANPTRITVPVTGLYRVSANVAWGAGTGGSREIFVRKNGTSPAPFGIGRDKRDQSASGGAKQAVSSMSISLTAGDYLELRCLSSVDDDVIAAAPTTTDTWFAVEHIPSI